MEYKKGIYRHFKGQLYDLQNLARHSETEELFVVYQALYGEKGIWVRPAEMFFDMVERDGILQSRFTYLADRADFSDNGVSENDEPNHNNLKKDILMAKAKQGDLVKINFTGTLKDGTVFDTTLPDEENPEEAAMELTIGEGEIFAEVEEALIGMSPGEKKTVFIAADDAFGPYDEENVFSIAREQLPPEPLPELGQEVELTDEDGESLAVTVVEITEEDITFDSNHPLAGQDLTYEVELTEIL
jgi:peptidylprolyl isomerase